MKHIDKLYTRDLKLANIMRCSGCISSTNILKIMKPTRVNTYCRDKLLKKEGDNYRLTEKGRKFYKSKLDFNNFYSFRSYSHDLNISDKMVNLLEKHDMKDIEFKTERDQMQEFLDKMREDETYKLRELENKISATDLAYTVGGVTYSYEIITKNYKETEIVAKEVFSEIMNYNLTMEVV